MKDPTLDYLYSPILTGLILQMKEFIRLYDLNEDQRKILAERLNLEIIGSKDSYLKSTDNNIPCTDYCTESTKEIK